MEGVTKGEGERQKEMPVENKGGETLMDELAFSFILS